MENKIQKGGQLQQLQTSSNTKEINTDLVFSKSVPSLRRSEGSAAIVQALLADMQNGLNIDKPMTLEQLDECAEEIITEYGHFKVHDIQVFCRGCKYGRYGKAYNRLNGQIIFEWLALFDQERTMKIQDARRKEQQQRSKELEESDVQDWDDMAAIYDKARQEQREKMEKRKAREEIWAQHREQNKDKILENMQRTMKNNNFKKV